MKTVGGGFGPAKKDTIKNLNDRNNIYFSFCSRAAPYFPLKYLTIICAFMFWELITSSI